MIPPIEELIKLLAKPNPEFEAWAHSLPPTHWVKRDISAARMGWEAHQATASGSPFKSFDSDGLDTHRLAD